MFIECGKSNISSYDLLGNPCNYLGNVLEWKRGRNLMRFGNHTYRYNANGAASMTFASTLIGALYNQKILEMSEFPTTSYLPVIPTPTTGY